MKNNETLGDVISKEFENIYNQGCKETAREIFDLCCGHGTTYIKKYLKEKYGVDLGD